MKPGQLSVVAICVVVIMEAATAAEARPARCFATDDGYYPCDFKRLDSSGSFRTSARGHPRIRMDLSRPGAAWGYVNFGHGEEAIPGEYARDQADGACWDNPDARKTKICVW